MVGSLLWDEHTAAFEYDASFVPVGCDLSPVKMELGAGLQRAPLVPFNGLHGLFEDSLPDGWGRILTDRYLRSIGGDPTTLTPIDRLAWVGTRAIGALSYEPRHLAEIEKQVDLHALGKEAQLVVDDKATDALETLLRAGGSPQGARPKVLVLMGDDSVITGVEHREGFDSFLVKFASRSDEMATVGALEYAYSVMASAAGVSMPETKLVASTGDHLGHFAIKRFDRRGAQRVHTHTVAGLLNAPPVENGVDYEDLLNLTRGMTKDARQVEQMFTRACFNVYSNNRDDHLRNTAFLMEPDGSWHLAPAYDIVYNQGPGFQHSIPIAGEGSNPTSKHLLRIADEASINDKSATTIIDQVRDTCSRWSEFAKKVSLPKSVWEPINEALQSKE